MHMKRDQLRKLRKMSRHELRARSSALVTQCCEEASYRFGLDRNPDAIWSAGERVTRPSTIPGLIERRAASRRRRASRQPPGLRQRDHQGGRRDLPPRVRVVRHGGAVSETSVAWQADPLSGQPVAQRLPYPRAHLRRQQRQRRREVRLGTESASVSARPRKGVPPDRRREVRVGRPRADRQLGGRQPLQRRHQLDERAGSRHPQSRRGAGRARSSRDRRRSRPRAPADSSARCRSMRRYIERHLSFYFSPYNHLIGEATALFVIGSLLPWLRPAARWRDRGWAILEAEMPKQYHEDGGTVEQATGYHHFTLGFHLQAHARETPHWRARSGGRLWSDLEKALEFSMHMTRPDGSMPMIGDADEGKAFSLVQPDLWDFRVFLASAPCLFGRGDFKKMGGALPAGRRVAGRNERTGRRTTRSAEGPGRNVESAADERLLHHAHRLGSAGALPGLRLRRACGRCVGARHAVGGARTRRYALDRSLGIWRTAARRSGFLDLQRQPRTGTAISGKPRRTTRSSSTGARRRNSGAVSSGRMRRERKRMSGSRSARSTTPRDHISDISGCASPSRIAGRSSSSSLTTGSCATSCSAKASMRWTAVSISPRRT